MGGRGERSVFSFDFGWFVSLPPDGARQRPDTPGTSTRANLIISEVYFTPWVLGKTLFCHEVALIHPVSNNASTLELTVLNG